MLTQDNNGMTPLHTAALKNNVPVAAVLVQRGADVNYKTTTEWTPLRVAAYANAPEMINFLRLNGAVE